MTDTLKSICEQCTHLNRPRLNSVPEELDRLRQILLRDLQELRSAASLNLHKSVTVLSGILLEAILYGFLKGQEDYLRARAGPDGPVEAGKTLGKYLKVFNTFFKGRFPSGLLPDKAADYRNFVHVNRELSYPPEICVGASVEMLRILDSVLAKFAEFAE